MINAWYLDDGTVCGSADDVCSALTIIEEDGPSRGLNLNKAKLLLFIPPDDSLTHNPLPVDTPIARGGFDLLGAPISPPSYYEFTMLKRVKKVQMTLARISNQQDSQMETTLLQSCLALPKVALL